MKDILIWISVWFGVWGVWNIFFKPKLNKTKNRYIVEGGYFTLVSLATLVLFEPLLKQYAWWLLLAFLICTSLGLILSGKKGFTKRIKSGKYFLLLHPFNIFFQQSMVIIGVYALSKYLGNSYKDIYFGIGFAAFHSPVVFLKWAKLKYLYISGALLGGITFSYLARNITGGVAISYLLHYLVYIWIIYYLKDQNKI